MTITPARLLRLFPRFWRERYGDEFLALLESTHLTRRHVIDVVRAAAGEWLVRTLSGRVLIALGLSTAATACALALQALVTTPPTITHDGGGTLIAPPWPVTLGFARGLLIFAGVGRWVSAWFAGAPRVGSREFRVWLLALFLAATGSQWGTLVARDGTGIARDSLFEIWSGEALMMFTCLIQLLMAGDHVYDPRLRPRPPGSTAPQARPLGLFGPDRLQP